MNTRHISSEEFRNKIMSEPVYFYNDFENAVVKAIRVEDKIEYYVKLMGRSEFKAVPRSGVVTEALVSCMEISEGAYYSF